MKFSQLYGLLNEQKELDFPLYLDDETLHDRLIGLGWRYLSAGSFGTVYHKKNKDFVLKTYRDSSYDNYLDFIKENSDNPHVVKLLKQFGPFSDGTKMVAIEKLKPVNAPRWREFISERYADFLNTYKDPSFDFEKSLQDFEKWFEYKSQETYNYFVKYRKTASETTNAVKKAKRRVGFFIENYLDLFKIIYKLDQFRDSYTTLDLHFGNFMIRPSTGEIVVTDPLC